MGDGYDTDGFTTEEVSGIELLKDWAAFVGVGAYLGATYGYLRLTRKIQPPIPLPNLAGAMVLSKLGRLVGARQGRLVPVEHDGGHSYLARGPLQTTDQESVSRLMVFEDGKPLGPRAAHPEIRDKGEGRFSHWGWRYDFNAYGVPTPYSIVLFSASDNSDPRSNGRSYTYALA